MINLKKLLAGVSAFAVAASSMFIPSVGAQYSADAEYVAAFNWMSENGLTSTTSPEAFNPGGTMLREHLSRFATYFGLGDQCLVPDMGASCEFSDLYTADPSLQKYITTACQLGVLKGSNGMFMPKQGLTRAQFFVAMVRMLEGDKSESVNPWYGNYFAAAQRLGLTKETDVFAQDRFITRYEAALILYRARNTNEAEVCDFDPRLIDGDQDLWDWLEDLFGNNSESSSSTGDTIVAPTSNGTLSVSLDSSSPAGGNVAGNTSVAVSAFRFTATTEDVALNTISLQRFGLSANAAVTRIELVVNGQVVGRDRSLNSDGKATFSFSRPIVVPAGQSVVVHAIATIGSAEGAGNVSNQRFSIGLVDFGSNGTNAKSNLPVKGNEFVIAGVNGAGITVSADGVVSNKRLGATGAEVAKFRIRNDANTEDVFVTEITLRDLENNADDNLRNLTLRSSNGTVLATVQSVSANNNGAFTFTLSNPIEIKRGQTQRFNVVADIVDGAGDDSNIVVERSSNVKGYSSQLGLGLATTVNAFGTANSFTITAGELTISKNALPATKLTKNRDNFVLASWDFIVASGQALSLEDIDLKLELEGAAAAGVLSNQFRNVSLRVNGVLSDLDLNELVAGKEVRLTETNMGFTLPAGQTSKVEVVVDTVNTFAAAFLNRYVRVELSAAPARLKIEETNDSTRVSSITPSVSVSDRVQIVDVAVSILPVALSNTNAVVGSQNVVAGDFQVRTTDAGSAELQSLTIEGNANFASTHISAVKLWRRVAGVNNWELVDSKGGFDIVTNRVTFDNFGEVVIPTSSTQDMRVTVDVVNNTANNNAVVGPLVIVANGTNIFDADNNNVDIQWAGVNQSSLGRTITLQGQGTLNVSVRNNDSLTNQPKSVVAGATSDYVAAFEFVATNEGILVEDLNVVAAGNNFASRVSALEVYAMSGSEAVLVARESTVGGNTTQFNNVNITVPQGSTRLYLKAVTRRYGQASGGADVTTTEAVNDGITFSLAVTNARGASSSEDVVAAATAASNAMFVYPVRVSNVSFVTSAEGVTIGNVSAGNGENIAILRVTADNWSNTDTSNGTLLTALITQLRLRSSSTNLTNLSVERLGVGNSTQVIGAQVLADYTFNLAAAPAVIHELDRQQVAFFLVRGDLANQANNYSVRVSVENLNGGDLLYTHDGAGAGTVNALNIGVTRLESNSITVLQ